MDVQLVVYDEEGTEHLFGAKQSYTFPETEFADHVEQLKEESDFAVTEVNYSVKDALEEKLGELDTNDLSRMKGIEVNDDGSITLLTGREYKVTDEKAADTQYAKWSVDLDVCFDKDVKAELEYTDNVAAAAYLGTVIAKKALEKGIDTVVFDRGGFIYAGKIQALADAAREAGLNF